MNYKRLLVLMLAGLLSWFVIQKAAPTKSNETADRAMPSSPSPSLVPFQELTIPYLRSRTYQSQLGDLEKVSETETYTSYLTNYNSDGLRINGLLTIPKGKEKSPAIVFVHGYIPPTQYKTQEKYVAYVDYLARNGIVVFKIDLRGHGNSEGDAGGAYYSSDYVIDALNAYTALQKAAFVKADEIGLWGHSMAGNVVLRSVAAKPEISAAAIWAGAGFTYTDLLEYRIRDMSYRPPSQNTDRQRRRRELFAAHGEFNENNAFWKQVVPTNYLSDFKGAIALHHAVDDEVVSVEYSRNLKQILEVVPVVHEVFEYQSGGHNISGSSFSLAMQRTVTFFQTHFSKRD